MATTKGMDSLAENFQQLEMGSNPLKNPVILAHLFQLCPPKVLANFRLVCKQWRDVSLPVWRTTLRLTFRLLSNNIHLGNRFTPLDKYLEYVKDPRNDCISQPFRHMILADWKFTSNIAQLKEFLAALSSSVTVLELHNCHFPNTDGFRKVIYKYFPNLQRLIIEMCHFRNPASLEHLDQWEYTQPTHGEHKSLRYIKVFINRYNDNRSRPYQLNLPVTWLELLSHFQNLTSLLYVMREVEFSEMRRECEGLFKSMQIVRNSQGRHKLPLKFLGIFPTMGVNHSNEPLLRELKLPFDSLIIYVENEENGQYLKNILEVHAKLLWKVIITNMTGKPLSWNFLPLDVSQFENLFYVQLNQLLCDRSLTFLKYMPQLRGLELQMESKAGVYKKVKLISEDCRLELANMKWVNLTYFVCRYNVDDEDLAMFIKWMPNMMKLVMVLNDRQFGMVCDNWRKLRRVKVLGQELTDEGVTGRKKKVQGAGADPSGEGEEGKVEEKETVQPNITYLKKLRAFSFWSKKLSEASVLQGIVGLPNLKILQPCLGEPLRLSKDAEYVLWAKRIKLVGADEDVSDEEDFEEDIIT